MIWLYSQTRLRLSRERRHKDFCGKNCFCVLASLSGGVLSFLCLDVEFFHSLVLSSYQSLAKFCAKLLKYKLYKLFCKPQKIVLFSNF